MTFEFRSGPFDSLINKDIDHLSLFRRNKIDRCDKIYQDYDNS